MTPFAKSTIIVRFSKLTASAYSEPIIVAKYVQLGMAQAVHETDKAVLCEFNKGFFGRWVPKSQIAPSSQVRRVGDVGILEVTAWWADANGIAEQISQHDVPPAAPSANLAEARSIYRLLTAKYHPDRNPDAEEIMKDINELWQAVTRAVSQK